MKDLREVWRAENQTEKGADDILLYCLLRAVKAKSNDKRTVLAGLIYKCFTPITNPRKLAAGYEPWRGVYTALQHVAAYCDTYRMIGCIETDEERQLLRSLVFDLLTRKIKLADRRFMCFMVSDNLPRDQQVLRTTQAALNMVNRMAVRRRGKRKTSVAEVPPTNVQRQRFNLQGVNVLLLTVRTMEPNLQDKAVEIGRHMALIESGDPNVLCSMPIRASVLQRRKLLEFYERVRL
jgi:hypothetical protein